MTGLVVREFQDQLAQIHQAHGEAPEEEIHALYLLALEREQIVTSHYAGDALHARIRAMNIPESVKQLIHHAMRWASRDEDMHTVYTRGILFRKGEWLLAVRAILQQLGGLVAGWSSAVSQHTTFANAPFSRLLAAMISYTGLMLGKVPRSARRTLSYQTFAGFAAFNAEAEQTAAMSWERVGELDAANAVLCRRVADDERKHGAVFQMFVEAFTPGDTLVEGVTEQQLTRRLLTIDPVFVPRDKRDDAHGMGMGLDVHVQEAPEASYRELFETTVLNSGLLDRVLAASPGGTVVIKTAFMMSYDRRDRSTTVDTELLATLCEALHARGAREIVVLESSNLFDRYFQNRSVAEVAEYMRLRFPHARLLDSALDQVPHVYKRGLGQNSISRTWRDAQIRISLAKMRTNPSYLVHLTTANLETLGQRIDHVLFADRVADTSTGLMMILDEFPCHLAILDAGRHVADGITGTLGTAHPRHPGRLYASEDAIALDWVATHHMGLKTLPRGTSCSAALDWFGDNRHRTRVIGVDRVIEPFTNGHHGDVRVFLSTLAYPVYAYLSGGGSLWLPRMDPEAFPPVRRESFILRGVRALLRAVFRFGTPPTNGTKALPART